MYLTSLVVFLITSKHMEVSYKTNFLRGNNTMLKVLNLKHLLCIPTSRAKLISEPFVLSNVNTVWVTAAEAPEGSARSN